MPDLSEKIINRAERRFNHGNDHFAARGILAILALAMMEPKVRQSTLLDSNDGIVRMLDQNGAEGEVYAERTDQGNGPQDSTDFVLVRKRGGAATGASRNREYGSSAVVRASTSEIDH